jgi:hypothetical protein
MSDNRTSPMHPRHAELMLSCCRAGHTYQVRKSDGSLYIPEDSSPGNTGRINSRTVAEIFARDCGGTVEVVS